MAAPDALLSAGQALGVIDDAGGASRDFFANPLETLGAMLSSKFRRERLVSAIDALLPPDTAAGSNAESKRYPLLPDDLRGQLYLVALLGPDVDVTFALDASFEVTDGLTVGLRIPLVRGHGDGEDPVVVAGGPDGRVHARMRYAPDTVSVEVQGTAWVEAGVPQGVFGVRLSGLIVDGAPMPDLSFSTDELAHGAVDAIVRILRFVLDATGATATPVVRLLAEHLPGLLGVTTDVGRPLPLADLARDPAALRRWVAGLADGDAAPLRAWLNHLGGLLGDPSDAGAGPPTAGDPWRAALTGDGVTPYLALEAWLDPDPDGAARVALGLLIRFAEPAGGRVGIEARAELVRLPLDGPAAVEILRTGSVLVQAPVGDSALVDTADLTVGSVRGGVRWDGTGARPVLEVVRLRLPGTDTVLPQLDLTDADVLAGAVRQEVQSFLAGKLGTPGAIGAALLTITGLDGGGPPLDLAVLASAPTRAIADHHRRSVVDGDWGSRQFRALAALFGVPAALVPPAGDAWRLTVVGTAEARLDLVAAARADGDRALIEIGLGFGASGDVPGLAGAGWNLTVDVDVLALDIAADAYTTTTLLPDITATLKIIGIDANLPAEVPLRCDGWSTRARWRPGAGLSLDHQLTGLALAVPGVDGDPVRLGDLVLPTTVDLTRPDLGLGLDVSGLSPLLAHLAARAIETALPTGSPLRPIAVTLAEASLWHAPDDLASLLSDPARLVARLLARPFDPAGPLAAVLPDLLAFIDLTGAGLAGTGSPLDAWFRPLGGTTRLTAWLSPEGPDLSAAVQAELGGPVALLEAYLAGGDGLVAADPENPPDLLVAAAHPDVIAHPAAVAAIQDAVTGWRTADPQIPVVIVVPALLGTAGLEPLRAALGGGQLIDLNRQPGGPDPLDLTRYVAAPVHVVVTDDEHLDQLPPVLDRLVALHAGHPLALVGVSVAAPATLAATGAAPGAYAGVITVASIHDGECFDPADAGLVEAVRLVRGLSPLDGPHRRAIDALTGFIDGWLADADGPRRLRTPIDLITTGPPAAGGAAAALRIGGTCGSGLADAVGQAVLSRPPAAPQAVVVGVARPFLPVRAAVAGDVVVASEARLDLAAAGPARVGAPALALSVRVGRAGGWLLGPSSPTSEVQARQLQFTVRLGLSSPAAEADLAFTDVVVRGIHHGRVGPGDGPFANCLRLAVSVLQGAQQNPAVAALLDWLADAGIVRKPAAGSTGYAVLADALGAVLDDPADWLARRAATLLAAAWDGDGAAVLGLIPDRTAPAGARRWVWRSPDAPLTVTVEGDPWTVTVALTAPGVPIGDRIRLTGRCVAVLGEQATHEFEIAIGALRLRRTADGSITLLDPLLDGPVVLSERGGPALPQTVRQLAGPAGAALGASLLLSLVAPEGAPLPGWRALATLLTDPAAVLHPAAGAIGDVFAPLAEFLGLEVDGTAVTVVPGILAVDAAAAGGRPALTLRTPQALHPIPEVTLSASTSLGIDEAGHVHPAFTTELRLTLGGAATAWPELGLRFGIDEQGPRISFSIGDPDWIELVPHFAGVGVLTGPALQRLLPQALDLIVENTPTSDVKDRILAIARELDVYTTSFAAAPTSLAALTAGHLADHAGDLVTPVVDLLELVVGDTLPAGTISGAQGSAVTIHLGALLDGSLDLTVDFDPLAASVSLDGARAGPVRVDLDITGQTAPPGLSASLAVGVDLADAIGMIPLPTLALTVNVPGDPVTIDFHPLGTADADNVSIAFLPQVAVTLTETGKRDLVEQLAVIPGLHAVVNMLGTLIGDPLWLGGPSFRDLLVAASLLDEVTGRVKPSLPEPLDVIAGVTGVLAKRLHADLGTTLTLGFGDEQGLGPQLRGHLPFTTDAVEVRLLLGDEIGANPGRPVAVDILRPDAGHWRLRPRLRVNRTGLAVLGPNGEDLITSDVVRFGGFAAHVGFVVDVDISGAAPTFTVGQWAAGVDLTGISIPALSGGGGDTNPVASGLLASAADGEPVQPQFDLGIGWDGQLRLRLTGEEPDAPVWFPVDRSFGPLYIARIGVQTGSGTFAGEQLDYIGVLVDGAVSLAGLNVSVQGLTVRIPPKYPTRPDHWAFDLQGLAVTYENPSVSIVGGLLKEGSGAATQYLGMLQINVSGRGITALGGYGRTSDGQPSLFVFVVINTPIGGPPYLFVTGLAGGFGFNRRLIVPSNPEQAPSFPLLAALTGRLAGDPNTPEGAVALLQDMARSIPAERGMIWIAAGVKFTTFVLLETNAVLYVQFGNGFEIGLLGLMAARLPSAENTIATVELAMLAKYSTVDNTLAVRAQLTANSWLFTKDCRLTGGFAFMVWFDRPQAMVSLGGYHPDFPVPDHYPQVPRVGFRWSPMDGVTVKGESYFAVTPEAAMTGGRLEARAEVSGVGHGEFTMYLDALLWFDPPRFILDFGVRVNGKAFGFGFGVSASVHIELPPVHVLVHVDFMWGFDIEFGRRRAPRYLDFTAFTEKFLGAADAVCGLAITAGPAASAGPQDQDSAGLSRDNPLRVLPEFAVATTTKFPAVTASYAGTAVDPAAAQIRTFYLVPMGPGGPGFAPTHTVSAIRVGDNHNQPVTAELAGSVDVTGVPSALYWDATRGAVPGQDAMSVDYGDMASMVSGLRLRADSIIVTSPEQGVVDLAGIVDELPDLDAPMPGPAPLVPGPAPVPDGAVSLRPGADSAARVGAPAAVPRTAVPPPARTPVLRWDRATARPAAGERARRGGADGFAGAATAGAAASRAVPALQMWSVAGGGAWRVSGERPMLVRQFDPVGRLITTSTTHGAGHVLHPRTVAVAVQPAPAGSGLPAGSAADLAADPAAPYTGWQLHTRAHPVAASAFVTATCSVAFATPVNFPPRLAPADGIDMFALVAASGTVVTDLPLASTAIAVQLDQLAAGPDAVASTVVACDQANLVLAERVDAAGDGRVHLVYAVTDVDAGAAHLSVTVATRPGPDGALPWLASGVIVGTGTATELATQIQADPRAVLVPDLDPPGGAGPVPVVTFTPVEAPHG